MTFGLSSLIARRCVPVGAAAALLLMAPAHADTFTVDSLADAAVPNTNDGECTLREAIDRANGTTTMGDCNPVAAGGADEIQFSDTGTINLADIKLPTFQEPINITGPGPNDLIINAGNQSGIIDTDDFDSTISGVTLANGQLEGTGVYGAAISADSGNITVNNSVITGNTITANDPNCLAGAMLFNGGGGINTFSGNITVNSSEISNNEVIEGCATFGGGLAAGSGDVYITNSIIANNVSEAAYFAIGGGVAPANGDLTILNSVISGNRVETTLLGGTYAYLPAFGGGIACADGAVTINRSQILNNDAIAADGFAYGGGIDNSNQPLYIYDSLISGNNATRDGGGIESYASVNIYNSTLSGNTAGDDGGAVNTDGDANIYGSRLVDNSAGDSGGALDPEGFVLLVDSTLSGNSAVDDGGAIDVSGGGAIGRSTLSGNTTGDDGGAIYSRGYLAVYNSTFSGNSVTGAGSQGGAVFSTEFSGFAHTTFFGNTTQAGGVIHSTDTMYGFGAVSLINTIMASSTGSHCNADPGVNIGNVFDASTCGTQPMAGAPAPPLDPGLAATLGPLADNGGPTQTHALLAGSSAIDNADQANCGNGIDQDQRQAERPQGAGCDIGAFEADSPVLQVINNSAATVNANTGDTNVLALDVTLTPHDISPQAIQINDFSGGFCLNHTLDPNDITNVSVWQDGGDGVFDAGGGDDLLVDDNSGGAGALGTFTFDPNTFSFNVDLTAPGPAPVIAIGQEQQYFLSLSVDNMLFARNVIQSPSWTQTVLANHPGAQAQSLSLGMKVALLLLGLLLISLPFRGTRARGLRMLILTGFMATALTACPRGEDGDDDDGVGRSGLGPAEAVFCVSIDDVSATGFAMMAPTTNAPTAGLPVESSTVNFR